MDLEGLAVQRGALLQLLDQVGLARRRRKGRDEILVRADVVDDRSRLDHARPADQAGTRKPPSQLVAFSPLNGVVPPSGQVKTSAPLSVV